jgi:ABC-type cobalamin/Fe3+-siderophores transport system ATPase subunit
MRLFYHSHELSVYLEITPPQATDISPLATTQLFNLISGLINSGTFLDYLLFRKTSCSFEIVSRKETGIQYILRLPQYVSASIENDLRTYIPGIKIKETSDYLPDNLSEIKDTKVIEFELAKHFSLPLDEQSELGKHDPLAYLTGNMTQLDSDDLLAIQIILRPLNSFDQWFVQHEIARIQSAISINKFAELTYNTTALKAFYGFTGSLIVKALHIIIVSPIVFIVEHLLGLKPLPPVEPEIKTITPADLERQELVKAKICQPLFEATVRALLIVKKDQISAKEKSLVSSFASFNHSSGQSIRLKRNLFWKSIQRFHLKQFKLRQVGTPIYLTPAEVGSLYHFPFDTNSFAEDMVRVRSRELPAPLSIKQNNTKPDVIFGFNNYGGEMVPIGLTLEQRQKHMYVIGKTGMGKTTLLKSAIYQDMLSGKGLAVFDAHGDLLQELLSIIPESRQKDVIVFDPSDRQWPIGLNILSPGIDFTDKETEDEWITSSVIDIFIKITAKEYWGPKMQHILKNATLTALQTPNPSLYTIQQLLTDKEYQKRIAMTLKDPVLKQFWTREFALLGKMQLSSATAPLTQRLGSFITTKMSRHILLQEKSTISISQIMNEGKILLINLSKGDLGEDQSFFFGVMLISMIWMAAYQRIKIPEKDRRDFFLYVDEFQNFATPGFSDITSEGRKFHVSLIASHQNIAQIEDQNILKVVTGNANSIICLKASPDDEKFILPFMEPEVEKGDIVNLAPYHFFIKVANEKSENAFSGMTTPLNAESSDETKAKVIDYSRHHFAAPRKSVEEYLDKLFLGKLAEAPKVESKVETKTVETLKVQKKNKIKKAPGNSKKPQRNRTE